MADSNQQAPNGEEGSRFRESEFAGSPDPEPRTPNPVLPSRLRICAWCARVAGEEAAWLRAQLLVEGDGGELPWTARELDFCALSECRAQVTRVDGFLREIHDWHQANAERTSDLGPQTSDSGSEKSEARSPKSFPSEPRAESQVSDSRRVTVTFATEGTRSPKVERVQSFGYPDAIEDVRALCRFFAETSHPKLRRVLEAFEGANSSDPDLAGPRTPDPGPRL